MPNEFACVGGFVLLLAPAIYFIYQDICHLYRNRCSLRLSLTHNKTKDFDDDDIKIPLVSSDDEQFHQNNIESSSNPSTINIISDKTPEISHSLPLQKQWINIQIWFTSIMTFYICVRIFVTYFNYSRNFKYMAGELQDMEELCIRGFIIYSLGNIASRFSTTMLKKQFVFCIGWSLLLYTITFEQCPNITLSGETDDNENVSENTFFSANLLSILITSSVIIVQLYVLIRNFYIAWNTSLKYNRYFYFSGLMVVVVFHVFLISIFNYPSLIKIHVHHHHWSFVLAIVCRSHSDYMSFVLQAMAIGIFIHGMAVFGNEVLFEFVADEQMVQKFDGICESWHCVQYKCELPKL